MSNNNYDDDQLYSPRDEDLVVDLRGQEITCPDDFWQAIRGPLRLPSWFGENLDAWVDTLRGGISPYMDSFRCVVVKVDDEGVFGPNYELPERPGFKWGEVLMECFQEAGPKARLEIGGGGGEAE